MSAPVASGIDQGVDYRLHVRLDLPRARTRRSVDVSIPATACFDEAISELLGLLEAPQVDRPWQFASPSGTVLPNHVPLSELGLSQGMVLYLRPQRPVSPPVVRDAAEALAHEAEQAPMMRFAVDTASLAGLLGMLIAARGLPLPIADAYWAAASLTIAGAMTWARRTALLAVAATLFAGATMCLAMLGPSTRIEDLPSALLEQLGSGRSAAAVAAALGAAAATVIAAALLRVPALAIAALAASLGILTFSLLVGLLYPYAESDPAGVMVPLAAGALFCGLVLMSVAPAVATRVSGLRVPRLPSAGDTLEHSDPGTPQDVLETQAKQAHELHGGILLGIVCTCLPALFVLAQGRGWSVTLLCLATALACVMHAARHRSPLCGWCIWLLGLGGLLAAAANVQGVHWAMSAVVVLGGLVAVTGPLWQHLLDDLAPTTVVWWERAEALCVAMTFPLAATVVGVVDLIRGL